MTENYEEELKLIDGATDGPWFRDVWRDGSNTTGCMNVIQPDFEVTLCADILSEDANYIAHFNPSHMRQRIEREMAKDARLAEQEARIKEFENGLVALFRAMDNDDLRTQHAEIQLLRNKVEKELLK